jgi:glyceraldehyde-3-phosphate dehydrogenase type II
MTDTRVRVAVNGYGVIGKRVADAVTLQDDMELVGVADVSTDYRIRVAVERGFPIYASMPEQRSDMERAGIPVAGIPVAGIPVANDSVGAGRCTSTSPSQNRIAHDVR